jgi:hypothetical protein
MTAEAMIPENDMEFLRFLKARYPVYHASNIFFRDVQYGLAAYLAPQGVTLRPPRLEEQALAFLARMEGKGILRRIDAQTWAVTFDEFKTPVSKPAPAAKTAAA